jgi:Zn-dependent protease
MISQLIIVLPVLLFSVIVHEVAHGWAALKLGDPTAAREGRLTLDPRPHIDPVMSLLVPAMCLLSGAPIFGGARPVPVNPWYFRHPSRDMALVAAAGPVSNILLALIAGLLINLVLPLPDLNWSFEAYLTLVMSSGVVGNILAYAVMINLVLAAFNFLPIPPLDGSRVVAHFLPEDLSRRYRDLDRFGILIVFGVIFFFGGVLHAYIGWFLRVVGSLVL